MKEFRSKIWMYSFFSLVFLIVVAFVVIIVMLNRYAPAVEESKDPPVESIIEKTATFQVTTTKDQLNILITEWFKQQNDLPYTVILEDTVKFQSSIVLLGRIVPITLDFDPEVTKGGNIILHLQSFSIGGFQLPGDIVLQAVRNAVELPKWVEIYADQQYVYVTISEVKFSESMSINVISFDLEGDVIEFELYYLHMTER
ncbi:YpmS family protein [Anaerobacillus sp. MEB173]|uniref:YpmS family protein n=1 Tax=Anaerobacillus sp. MEB173 TaxID=3383345 RepID=UPI003F8F48CB